MTQGTILNRRAAKSSVRNFGSRQRVNCSGTTVIPLDWRSTARFVRSVNLG